MNNNNIPIITVDGPAGSGKGTISQLLAEQLGWHVLDSGALYRLTALAALKHNIPTNDEKQLSELAIKLDVTFTKGNVYLESQIVSDEIRTEECGNCASLIAAIPAVREALLERQRAFHQYPGLVADGRDMGTVVFKDAPIKIYLTASPEERAKRRYKQLKEKGINASLSALISEIKERDERDMNRSEAPLKPADDAFVLDSSNKSIDDVLFEIMKVVKNNT